MIRDETFHEKIKKIHYEMCGKPYDLIKAKLNLKQPFPIWKWTNRFWCSAFVSYIYYEFGWISECNWSLIAPREYSIESTGQLIFTCIISDEEFLV